MDKTFDFNKVSDMMHKNMESYSEATQIMTDGAMAFMKRSAEIGQRHVANLFDIVKDITAAKSPEQAYQKQQEYVKSCVDENLANSKEMIDMATKSSMEAFSQANKKFSDNFKAPQKQK